MFLTNTKYIIFSYLFICNTFFEAIKCNSLAVNYHECKNSNEILDENQYNRKETVKKRVKRFLFPNIAVINTGCGCGGSRLGTGIGSGLGTGLGIINGFA